MFQNMPGEGTPDILIAFEVLSFEDIPLQLEVQLAGASTTHSGGSLLCLPEVFHQLDQQMLAALYQLWVRRHRGQLRHNDEGPL